MPYIAVCHFGLNPLERKRGKEGPFFHLQRHLVVSSNIIKLTIFKCFVTSVILQLSTGQEVILLLLASLNTVCSAVSNYLVQGAKSSYRTSKNSSSSSQLDRPQHSSSEQRAGESCMHQVFGKAPLRFKIAYIGSEHESDVCFRRVKMANEINPVLLR